MLETIQFGQYLKYFCLISPSLYDLKAIGEIGNVT